MKLETREVHIAHINCQLNSEVMEQIARNLTDCFDGFLKDMKYFVCDHDPLYTKAFRGILESAGVEVIQTRVGCPKTVTPKALSPRSNGVFEQANLFGENSLRKAIYEYVEHYHSERNHQGLDNLIPFLKASRTKVFEGTIVKSEWLGGLLKYYYRESDLEIEKEEQKVA